jgi:hypothetical protein
MQPGGKLPAKIASISDPGVHAVAARRDVLVRRIAGKKHPANSVTLGDQEMRRPGTREQDFVIEVMPGKITEHCASIDLLRRDVPRKPGLERPDVAVVLRDQSALGRLIVPCHAEMLEHVMRRRPKVYQEPVHDSRLTIQSDAETMPDLAGAPIAAGEVVAAHILHRRVGRTQRHRYTLHILRQLLQRHTPSRLDARERLHRAL